MQHLPGCPNAKGSVKRTSDTLMVVSFVSRLDAVLLPPASMIEVIEAVLLV